MLCCVLIVMETILSAGIRVQASESETEVQTESLPESTEPQTESLSGNTDQQPESSAEEADLNTVENEARTEAQADIQDAETDSAYTEDQTESETHGEDLREQGEIINSGWCGDNLRWKLIQLDDTGQKTELFIEGNGEFFSDYNSINKPWQSGHDSLKYCDKVIRATIKITGMKDASNMFNGCYKLEEVFFDTNYINRDVIDMFGMFNGCGRLQKIHGLSDCFRTENVKYMGSMFDGCESLTDIDLSGWDTGSLETMNCMFRSCWRLKHINLAGFTAENVTNAEDMFYGCTNLAVINTPRNLKISVSLENAGRSRWQMPDGTVITELPMNQSNSVEVKVVAGGTYEGITYELDSLDGYGKLTVEGKGEFSDTAGSSRAPWYNLRTDIQYAEINLTGTKDVSYMFYGCEGLLSVDLSGLDANKVVKTDAMFGECSNLQYIYTPPNLTVSIGLPEKESYAWFMPDGSMITELPKNLENSIKIVRNPYDKSNNIEWRIDNDGKLTVTGNGDFSDSKEIDRAPWYQDRWYIKSAEINVKGMIDASYMFYACKNLTSVDLSSFDTGEVKEAGWMLWDCPNLSRINTPRNLKISVELQSDSPWYWSMPDGTIITELPQNLEESVEIVKNIGGKCGDTAWFISPEGALSVAGTGEFADTYAFNRAPWYSYRDTIKLAHVNLKGTKDFSYMFNGCTCLTSVDWENTDTADMFDMTGMFQNCIALTGLDLSGFDAGNVTDADNIFEGCDVLEKISTPGNLKISAKLPEKENFFWCMADGTQVTELPKNTADSVLLEKKPRPVIAAPYLVVTKLKTVYNQGEVLNIDDLSVSYYDSDGVVRRIAEGYSTNADTIDMSVPGEKTLTISYMDVSTALTVTVLSSAGQYCTVTFELLGHGTVPEALTVLKGGLITEPETPTEKGYTFEGWYKEESCVNAWDFAADVVADDMTLYARWTKNEPEEPEPEPEPEPGPEPDTGLVIELNGIPYSYNNSPVRTDVSYMYTGSANKPEVRVTNNGSLLREGIDYTVKYANNVKAPADHAKDADKPKVIITARNNMKGNAILYFSINKKSIEETESGITAADPLTVVENSKAAPILYYAGVKLTADKDFKIDEANKNKKWKPEDTGGRITLTGIGNYKGTREINVNVIAKSSLQKFTVTPDRSMKDLTYDGTQHVPVFEVKDSKSKQPLNADDYYIVYPADMTNAGLKKYTVVGTGIYTGSSVTRSYTIKPCKDGSRVVIDDSGIKTEHAFKKTGVILEDGELKITDHGHPLTEGKDYKITYSSNKKAGTAKYKVTFIGNYKGMNSLRNQSGSFKITAAKLGDLEWNAAALDTVYKKPGIYKTKLYVTVDNILLKSSDYTVTYKLSNGEEMKGSSKLDLDRVSGTVTVLIKGKGNYSGEIETSYKVCKGGGEKIDISKAKITVVEKNATKKLKNVQYDGTKKMPGLYIQIKDGKSYREATGDEYAALAPHITYVNNVNKGTATVIVNGDSEKFIGSKTATFAIVQKDITGK